MPTMSVASSKTDARPPFRADHVGSLLRPPELAAARARHARGEIDGAALREAEDRAIRHAVALQEEAGLQSVTDGEYRRAFWQTDFLTGFDGIEATDSAYAVAFKGAEGEAGQPGSMMRVTGKVRRARPVMVDHFAYLKSATKRTAKFCMPAPTYLHMRGGRKIIGADIYPDLDGFWADIVTAYRAEIADLVAAGCTYLQFDDVSFAYLCDAEIRARVKADGMDPDALAAQYAAVINALVADRPAGLAVTIHTCRGNFQSMWRASGGYEAIAERAFAPMAVDGFFLEYDTERAGGFEPLRFMPKGKKVVLGLVSSKVPALESKDDLKRRIEAAARYVPLENLCLSPQCGFASTHHGNRVTEDDERRKLARIVEVAAEVWGGVS
ncbi:MAG TPA: 5-methyltetrahydropteroyltriglutamate--homocysteine S-methyltransferase [Alphaproteobacteria bacterium]|nr:5-methyltetrahydropteroyltriglutamate--homocysteine S-methyltransferase [Alphaproteobacteria bacterium]